MTSTIWTNIPLRKWCLSWESASICTSILTALTTVSVWMVACMNRNSQSKPRDSYSSHANLEEEKRRKGGKRMTYVQYEKCTIPSISSNHNQYQHQNNSNYSSSCQHLLIQHSGCYGNSLGTHWLFNSRFLVSRLTNTSSNKFLSTIALCCFPSSPRKRPN